MYTVYGVVGSPHSELCLFIQSHVDHVITLVLIIDNDKIIIHTSKCTSSLGTRPSLAEEEEGLVNLHTYKFEVRGISAE